MEESSSKSQDNPLGDEKLQTDEARLYYSKAEHGSEQQTSCISLQVNSEVALINYSH